MGCPSGWLAYQQNCYLLSTTEKSWSDSREQCVQHGSDLAVVRSSDEMVRRNCSNVLDWIHVVVLDEFWEHYCGLGDYDSVR